MRFKVGDVIRRTSRVKAGWIEIIVGVTDNHYEPESEAEYHLYPQSYWFRGFKSEDFYRQDRDAVDETSEFLFHANKSEVEFLKPFLNQDSYE